MRRTSPWGFLVLWICVVMGLSFATTTLTTRSAQAQGRKLIEGQSPNRLLKRMKVTGADRLSAARALKPLIDLSKHARAGDKISVRLGAGGELLEMVYTSKRRGRFVVQRQGGRLVASRKRGGNTRARDSSGDRPIDQLAEDEVSTTALWLRPNATDDEAARLKAYYKIRDETKRAQRAAELEGELGLDGLKKLLTRAFAPRDRPKGMLKKRLTLPGGTEIHYALFVPESYDPSKPLPLHISLHGRGGNGPGTCRLRWKAPQEEALVACPTSLGGLWYSPHGQGAVMGIYRQILRDYAVDTDRVILGGFSNGGNGTWQLGAHFPWLWSALTPRSGALLGRVKWRQNMCHLPVFITHGTEDGSIGVYHARQMVELLAELGNKARYIEIEGGGHDFFTHLNPQILAWMIDQKRVLRRSFLFHPIQHDVPERIYWLYIHGSGQIEAKVHPGEADHTLVEITTRWPPRRLQIHFPPGLADLTRPVRVLINGEEKFKGQVKASGWALLESFAQTGDLARASPHAITVGK